jgi:hypothetical protein
MSGGLLKTGNGIIIILDESKFMLFKPDGCQYCWIQPGQALDDHFVKKNNQTWQGKFDGMGLHHESEHGKTSPNQRDYVWARLCQNP